MITLAGGTMFLLWLGERITEFGLKMESVSLFLPEYRGRTTI